MGSSGLQIYSTTGGSEPPIGNIIRSCRIHDTCVKSKAQNRGAGLSLTSGSSHEAYNNLIWANRVGIFIDYSSTHKVYHNTIALNSDLAVFVGSGSGGTTVQNNIMWKNAGGTILDFGDSTLKTPNFTSDPHFVNA
jgi:nitrous oxidase accessory protein NosD